MRKQLLGLIAASFMLLFTSMANADSVVQVFSCKLHDGKTPADVAAVSSAWLKAAKSMGGGENLKVFIDYPLVANAGNGEFNFVLVGADAKTWGLFMNDYDGSPAAKVDEAWNKVASCSGNSLWQSFEIK